MIVCQSLDFCSEASLDSDEKLTLWIDDLDPATDAPLRIEDIHGQLGSLGQVDKGIEDATRPSVVEDLADLMGQLGKLRQR
ncbi:MAG: hypothetical protein ACPG77_19735, partial [Nannocystaceae bacterium]